MNTRNTPTASTHPAPSAVQSPESRAAHRVHYGPGDTITSDAARPADAPSVTSCLTCGSQVRIVSDGPTEAHYEPMGFGALVEAFGAWLQERYPTYDTESAESDPNQDTPGERVAAMADRVFLTRPADREREALVLGRAALALFQYAVAHGIDLPECVVRAMAAVRDGTLAYGSSAR